MNHLEHRPEGLYFVPGDFYLDPVKAVQRAVISHAHADHAIASNREVWCTEPTASFMKIRYRDRLKSLFHIKTFDEKFTIGNVSITLIPAGHMLGSAQVLIEYEGIRYCYTGDFKTRPDASCEPFRAVTCDVLITETTFAQPEYIHPPEESEFQKLEAYSHCNIVIGAYNLGKAQRVTLLASQLMKTRNIMVHPEAAIYHTAYQQGGISLGNWQHYNYREFRNSKNNILIAPPRALSTYLNEPSTLVLFATGWKRSPVRSHFNFYLSDHADWKEILEVVRFSGAKKIIPVHGDGKHLMQHLARQSVTQTSLF